jgi:hypothetical protein
MKRQGIRKDASLRESVHIIIVTEAHTIPIILNRQSLSNLVQIWRRHLMTEEGQRGTGHGHSKKRRKVCVMKIVSHRLVKFPVSLSLPPSIMSLLDVVERFNIVCRALSVNNTITQHMVPEVQALAALYSLDMPRHQTLLSLTIKAAENWHTHLVKTIMLSFDCAMQQQVKWTVAKASLRGDHLSIAKWLHASFHLSAVDVRSNNNSALRKACSNGYLGVLQYLHITFHLTSDDARASNNHALTSSCYYGYLDVVRYLHTSFQLTSDDARTNNNQALLWACENGHFAVVQYLHIEFKLTIEDTRTYHNYALRWACLNGHLAVIQYLHTAFRLTREDARTCDSQALVSAFSKGHLAVVQYLHTAFRLTREDARAINNETLRMAYRNGHFGVVDYLRTVFN